MNEGMDKQTPSYYAIIPANVRYADITANAKLLYGEISALCNQEGYCWASNKYFADLYKVDIRSIKRWMKQLVDIGSIHIDYDDESARTERKIYLYTSGKFSAPGQKSHGAVTKLSRPRDKNVTHNNTNNNTVNTFTKVNGESVLTDVPKTIISDDKSQEVVEGEIVKPRRYGKPDINEAFAYWKEIMGYPITAMVAKNRNACSNLIKRHTLQKLKWYINQTYEANNDKYSGVNICDFISMQSGMNRLNGWGFREKTPSFGVVDSGMPTVDEALKNFMKKEVPRPIYHDGCTEDRCRDSGYGECPVFKPTVNRDGLNRFQQMHSNLTRQMAVA